MKSDPIHLAREQIERDKVRTRAFPRLLAHKMERMAASPFAYLRGAAPLFYRILASRPELARGPEGEGWIVGDIHLENFGVYRAKEKVIFDINDFDDTIRGPWRIDVLRLTTSLILAGRELRARGTTIVELCESLIDAYVARTAGKKSRVPAPRCVEELVSRARTRTRKALLDGRTRVVRGKRMLVRGYRYFELPSPLRRRAEEAFAEFAAELVANEGIDPAQLEVVDAAFRVAGTGSLGALRVAVLVRGKGGRDGAALFDMKEEGPPSPSLLLGGVRMDPAERVSQGLQRCLKTAPRMTGTTKLDGRSMFVRRLAPQEDKLDFSSLAPDELDPLARYLGTKLAGAHLRAASSPAVKPWRSADAARLIEHAIVMAGIHEAAYLAHCADARGGISLR